MKNAIIGMVCFILLALTVLAFSKMSNTGTRDSELKTCVSESVENTLDGARNKEFHSNEEMIADFKQNLEASINSNGKLEVKIYGVDYHTGMLDAEVTQTYHIDGKDKQVTQRRLALLEERERGGKGK